MSEEIRESIEQLRNSIRSIQIGDMEAAALEEIQKELELLTEPRDRIKLVLPWPPSANHYMGERIVVPRDKLRKPFVQRYHTQEATAFFAEVSRRVKVAGVDLNFEGNCKIVIKAFKPNRRRRDTDNLNKCAFDSLSTKFEKRGGQKIMIDKLVWKDDSQVCDQRLYWGGIDKDNPRLEVTITRVGDEQFNF